MHRQDVRDPVLCQVLAVLRICKWIKASKPLEMRISRISLSSRNAFLHVESKKEVGKNGCSWHAVMLAWAFMDCRAIHTGEQETAGEELSSLPAESVQVGLSGVTWPPGTHFKAREPVVTLADQASKYC